MTYTELKKECVLETLGVGATVLVCDFKTMKILDCTKLTVGAINSYIARSDTLFFEVIADE